MKKTLSKKIKSGKELSSVKKKETNTQLTTLDGGGANTPIEDKPFSKNNDNWHIYKVNVDPTGKIHERDFSSQRSTTTYEANTTSTSESDRDPKDGRIGRGVYRKNGITYRGGDPDLCYTVNQGGKPRIHIVGSNNPGPSGGPVKQVEFASFDAVYGTRSDVSSDEESDNMEFCKEKTAVYRVDGQDQKGFPQHANSSSGKDGLTGGNQERENIQNNLTSVKHEGNDARQFVNKSKAQPSLGMPVFSVNIQTSQGEIPQDNSNNKLSSQLLKLKQHLFGTDNKVGTDLEQQNHSERDGGDTRFENKDGTIEHHNTDVINSHEDTSKHPGSTIDEMIEKGIDTADLRDAFEQILKISNQNNGSKNSILGKIVGNTKSVSNGRHSEKIKLISNTITRPLIYLATMGNDVVPDLTQRCSNDEAADERKENTQKIASESTTKTLKKTQSKQFPKKKASVVGSKVGIKKSSRSFVTSYFPKASSACSTKRSLTAVSKINRSFQGSFSKTSKKYFPREIMVIPEEQQVGQQFADIYPANTLDFEIPEETVILTEREIRLHNFNDLEGDGKYSTSVSEKEPKSSNLQKARRVTDENTGTDLKTNYKGSIPCLYHCSTSTVDTGNENKNEFIVNSLITQRDIDKTGFLDKYVVSGKYQNNEIIDKPYDESDYDENVNTILIDPEAHREIMEAIGASNGETRIITLPSKISRKDSLGNRLSLGINKSKDPNSSKGRVPSITEEDTQDEMRSNLLKRNVKPVQIVSTDGTTDMAVNTETDRSEIGGEEDHYTLQTAPKESRPFSKENQHENATRIIAFPARIDDTNPMGYKDNENLGKVGEDSQGNKQQKKGNGKRKSTGKAKNRESKVLPTILSFSEPLIVDEPQNDMNDSVEKITRTYSSTKKRKSKTPKHLTEVPDTMVYVGRLPNTSYNVFFTPDSPGNKRFQEGDDGNSPKNIKSDTKKLGPIKSEKLLAQGPKAILIFVNKKTELNRNPFDGNVMYDDDDYYGSRGKDKLGRGGDKYGKGGDKSGRDGDKYGKGGDKYGRGGDKYGRDGDKYGRDGDKGRGKGKDQRKSGKHKRSDDAKSGKSVRSGKSGKSGKQGRGSDFDVSSALYAGGRRSDGEDGVIVERSPSGLQTVVKYPCGCMRITKIDLENETSTEEVTSAFCTLGSKCEISQSQGNKRLLRYARDESESRPPSRGPPTYRGPKCPQLDIVLEGLVSKKPIKPQPPAQQMRGANLTGTLTIKTNRCNGVFNFYIDPKLKQYLRNNVRCFGDTRDSYSSRRYS